MPKIRRDAIGRAGEHYVAAELNRRGAYASPFSGNVPGIDILATDHDREHVAHIQVKTKRAGGNWQVGLQPGWAQITPYGCPGNGDCAVACTPSLNDPIPGKLDHYWVFVSLQKDGGQKYYIVADDVVRSVMVRQRHKAYLAKHGGQRPGKKHDSLHHSFTDRDIECWRDKWHCLGLGPLLVE